MEVSATPIEVDVVDASPALNGGQRVELMTGHELSALGRQPLPDGTDGTTLRRVGVAADGTSRLLLRFRVPAGLGDVDCGVEGGPANGRCEPIPGGRGADGAYYAYAEYTAPDEFGSGAGPGARRDRDLVEVRDVTVNLTYRPDQDGPTLHARATLELARPPVVLVHGTFENPDSTWRTDLMGRRSDPSFLAPAPDSPAVVSFVRALETAGFAVFTVDYRATNTASFEVNKRVVWENPGGIRDALDAFRRRGLAATRADVVGHSLGGLLPRVYAAGSYEKLEPQHRNQRAANWGRGDINRLITLCTPHHGSELPALLRSLHDVELFKSGPRTAALAKLVVLKKWWDGVGLDGAVQDQRPGSPALGGIGATARIPAFAIGCVAGPRELDDAVTDPDATYRKTLEDLAWLFYQAPGLLEQHLARHGSGEEGALLSLALEAEYRRWIERHHESWVGIRGGGAPPGQQTKLVLDLIRQAVFRYDRNDYTVRLSSQHGGLPPSHTLDIGSGGERATDRDASAVETRRPGLPAPGAEPSGGRREAGVLHSFAPRDWRVQRRVIELLQTGRTGDGAVFRAAGFPEAGQALGDGRPPRWVLDSLRAIVSDGLVTDEELAIRHSGMVRVHARKFLAEADHRKEIVLVRPVNADATALIEQGRATKGMLIKAKSADWGPQRGYLPVDQKYGKKATADAREVARYNCEATGTLALPGPVAIAKPLTIVEGSEQYEVHRLEGESSGRHEQYRCAPPDDHDDWVRELEGRLPPGRPTVLLRRAGETRYRSADGEPLAATRLETLPLEVLATPSGNFLTADYDLLAVGRRGEPCRVVEDKDRGNMARIRFGGPADIMRATIDLVKPGQAMPPARWPSPRDEEFDWTLFESVLQSMRGNSQYAWMARMDGLVRYEDMADVVAAIERLAADGPRLLDLLQGAGLQEAAARAMGAVLCERAEHLEVVLRERFGGGAAAPKNLCSARSGALLTPVRKAA